MFSGRFLFVLVLLTSAAAHASGPRYQFELNTKTGLSQHSPVWVNLPKELIDSAELKLTSPANGKSLPCQVSEDGQRIVFLLPTPLTAKETQYYEVAASDEKLLDQVYVVREKGRLSLKINDTNVLTYHTEIVEPPEGHSKLYRRSGYIHPFVTPSGKIVTDGFPIDHMHQHGVFAAWTKTFFEGKRVDFWNQFAGTGTVLHKEVLETTSGPVFASFQMRLSHTVLKESPLPVLDEVWIVRLYKHPDVHLFDIESVQKCVAETPLTIAEYHYGGFAFRGSAEWNEKGSHQIITNETTDRKIGNHTRPNWVSIFGKVDGEVCGAAMFSDPTNFRSPQPVRLHPSMPYFVYAPSVLGEFDLKPGVPFRTKNRYLAFDGSPNQKLLDSLWNDYSQTPEISWKDIP